MEKGTAKWTFLVVKEICPGGVMSVSELLRKLRSGTGREQASRPLELVSRQSSDEAFHLKDRESRQNLRGGKARAGDQFVDAGGLSFKLAQQ
jgi:hypothetical protein